MTSKIPIKDMIVILPGILGSVLQKDNKDLWAVSGQAIWQFLSNSGETLQDLKLIQDDPEAETLDDGIRPTALIQDTHLLPGLWKIDGYTKTTGLITDNFDVTLGDIYNDPDDKAANLYHFPYDWRRDNRANARLLKKLIDKRLKRWREASGASEAKVILLAHSMGGLVSRYYLEVLEGWRDSKALFTFGTPYRGSLKAMNFLANGYKNNSFFSGLNEVVRSLTSIYQLLPIYKVIELDGEAHRIAEIDGLPNIDQLRALDALAFHREIEAAVSKNRRDENYLNSFSVVPVVGIRQPTLQSAKLVDGKLTVSEELPKILQGRTDLGDGDGTVPQVSAIPIEFSDADILKSCFIAESHGALQNQNQVLQDLQKRIATSQFPLPTVRAPQTAISLALEDLYLPDEPISMGARVISTPGSVTEKLKAEITSVSGDRSTFHLDFESREQEWVLNTDLPSGLYRVKVYAQNSQGEAPTSVQDIFEVVKE